MKVAMIGQKGVPATHGGVERHVEELGARLAAAGHDVTVFTRPNYTEADVTSHRGMTLRSLPSVGTKHLDAITHSLFATFACWRGGFDVVHYHAIGPCLVSPFARLRGRRVVATVHAQDWQREKWGRVAATILQVAEWMALHVPHRTICVSESLSKRYRDERGVDVVYIPNGITLQEGEDPAFLSGLGVEPGGYLLFAGRIVPEKGLHYLLEAYEAAGITTPLVVAGDTSFSDDYVAQVRRAEGERVKFSGYVYAEQLSTLFRNAALFVLPSDLEGLPIVLLEALGYGVPVLASDIAPNVEVLGDKGRYFSAGDTASLATSLEECLDSLDRLTGEARELREQALREYDWDRVTELTAQTYVDAQGR